MKKGLSNPMNDLEIRKKRLSMNGGPIHGSRKVFGKHVSSIASKFLDRATPGKNQIQVVFKGRNTKFLILEHKHLLPMDEPFGATFIAMCRIFGWEPGKDDNLAFVFKLNGDLIDPSKSPQDYRIKPQSVIHIDIMTWGHFYGDEPFYTFI